MLENLKPERVFQYFEEISRIPHGSGNVAAISDYLVAFAKNHHLQVMQDGLKNVIIIKEASEDRKDRPPVMLQGHMDMVTVKDAGVDMDLKKDALRLRVDGDYLSAEGTSLGGDDGIAVAYGLALLSDDHISHPRLELVITTEEEVGMEGASGIDLSICQGKQMLNIDSEEEGEFVVACAGGLRVNGRITVCRETDRENRKRYKVMLIGFAGGHSGTEIYKNSGNANVLMGQFLKKLAKEVDIKLESLQGGEKDNAISTFAYVVLGIRAEDETQFLDVCKKLEAEMKQQYKETDPDCRMEILPYAEGEAGMADKTLQNSVSYLNAADFETLVSVFAEMPNGVQSMSRELEGLVQTSLNFGIMELFEKELSIAFSLRSSDAGEKEALREKVCKILEMHHARVEITGDYPAWEYKKDSPLREHMLTIYEKQYGKKPEVISLHAGLECGILAAKKPGLDCVSFGPDILDIHTTKERMSISSVQRVWNFLVEVIETL